MRPVEDGGGRGATPPAPRRKLPPMPAQASVDDGPRASRLRSTQQLGPVVQSQAQQLPFFQVSPARAKVIDVNPGSELTDLFQQKNPLSVEIVPKQKPVVIQAQPDPGYMDGTFPSNKADVDKEFVAQAAVDQKNQDAKTAKRLLMRQEYEAADKTETAQALSPKEWAALNPLQQAAAQANYDLSLAVKRDFESQGKYKADDTQVKGYQDRVKELFGEEESLGYKGLEYAPNTLAFLDSRGIEAANLAGRTLDDLLSGSALMTSDTFKDLGEQVQAPDVFHTAPADARGNNIQFAQQLAKGQLAYQEGLAAKLKQGGQLLTSITSVSTNADANKSYGALVPPSTRVPLTDVRPEVVAQFDMYMEALARTDSPIDKALEAISLDLGQRGASEKESAQVWQGLIERSNQAVSGEGKWFDGLDFPMRSPVEVAQALGAPTLKRQATLGAK